MDIKLALIAGLILISITLSIKIAGLLHRLKLSNRENETLRKEISESNKRQEQEIIAINKKHSKAVSNLKNEISKLQPPKPVISPNVLKMFGNHAKDLLDSDKMKKTPNKSIELTGACPCGFLSRQPVAHTRRYAM